MNKLLTLILVFCLPLTALTNSYAEFHGRGDVSIRILSDGIWQFSDNCWQSIANPRFDLPQATIPDTTQANLWLGKANAFSGAREFDSAVAYYKKAGSVFEELNNWENLVQCNNGIGISLRKSGDFNTALEFLELALETGLKELGKEHLEVAESYYNLGVVYSRKNDFDKAIEYFEESLAIRLKLLGEIHPDVASCYNALGSVYYATGNFNKTLEYSNKSLSLRLQTLDENHPDIMNSYNNIGCVYLEIGDYDNAFVCLNKSLTLNLQSADVNHPKVAGIYRNIGNVYNAKGDYDEALEYYNKALAIKLPLLGGEHPDVASSYNNIGLVHIKKRDFDMAFEYLSKSLAIKSESDGENNPDVATIYVNIGLAYMEKNDYEKALEYFNKSLSIRLQLFGEEHPDVSTCYHNIGNTYYQKGDYEKALEYHNKALAIRLQLLGNNHLNVAACYNSIGLSYLEMKDYDKSIEYFNKSLSVVFQLFGENHARVAQDYNNIGLVFIEKGDYDEALAYFNKAMLILHQLEDENYNDVAMTYNNIGVAYLKKDNYNQSLTNFQKALGSNVKGFDKGNFYNNPPLTGILSEIELERSLYHKAKALAALYEYGSGNIEDLYYSVATFQLTFDLIDKMRSGYKAEGSKLILAENTSAYAEEAIDATLKLYEATGDKQFQYMAFSFAEKNKAGVLYESVSEARARQFSGIPDSLLNHEKQLRTDLAFYETQIQKNELDSLTMEVFKGRFFTLKTGYEELIVLLEQKYPAYYKMKYDMSVATVGELQKVLQENKGAFIEYFMGEAFLYTLVITKDTFAVVKQAIGPSFYSDLEIFLNLLRSYNIIQVKNQERFFNYSHQFYNLLIRPVGQIINNCNNLTIISDNILSQLPFETLICSEENMEDFSTAEYLLKQHAISYHFSATLYLNSRKSAHEEYLHEKQWSGFAPVFGDTSNNNAVLTRNLHALKTDFGNPNFRAVSSDGKQFSPLPYSEHEVMSIDKLFKDNKQASDTYLNEQATEKSFKACCGEYKYIHLATHSIVNPDEPNLSGIIFSQPHNTGDGDGMPNFSFQGIENTDDGILYSGEIYNLDINADLVVLSSCESGIGLLAEGEGMMTLTRALLYAGAKNQLASLWKVEDKSSADLMISFYSLLLSGQSISEALRQAKLKMIEQNIPPVYWGAFVLTGE